MKKFLSVFIICTMILTSMPVLASEYNQEIDFAFDAYTTFKQNKSDECILMAVDEDVKTALEERLIIAWENMDTEVQLYPDIKIHKDDIASVFAQVFYENPKYYYIVRSFSGTVNSAGYMGKLTKLSYSTNSMEEVKTTWEKVDKAVEEMLLYIEPDMTDFEKVMSVHDYMVNNFEYDITDTDQDYLILLDKKGVCAAYAEAFQHLMNVLGIEASIVRSDEMKHLWSMVKLDSRWYHIDVTWDDPAPDNVAMVSHQYALLSTNEIKNMGHYDFEAPYTAASTTYNKASWRDDMGAMATIDGIMYRVEGSNLIDENDNVIYENLDGDDGKWSIGDGYIIRDKVLSGLCKINGILYFNTDKGIYSYNPATKETATVLEKEGICGIYADKNVLIYNAYDRDNGVFVKSGEIRIADMVMQKPYFEDGKAVVRLYNDTGVPLWIISNGEGCKIQKVDAKNMDTAEFENGNEQTLYVWKNSLEPVVEKITISE